MEKPLEAIEPFLTDSNVPFFTKLVSRLPTKSGANAHQLSASKINVVWCLKNFWSQIDNNKQVSGGTGENKENPVLTPMDVLDSIGESVKRIDVESDVVYLVQDLTLSRRSAAKLTCAERRELVKRIARMLKQSEHQQRLTKDLQRVQAHLKLVESVEKVCSGGSREYVELIDVELGNGVLGGGVGGGGKGESVNGGGGVEDVLVRMLLYESYAIEKLDELIEIVGIRESTSVKKLIKLALNKISTMPARHETTTKRLNSLLDSISKYLNSPSTVKQNFIIFFDFIYNFKLILFKKKGQEQTKCAKRR